MNKIVISDTSCLITLSNVGLLNILQKLYQEVLITSEVKEEFGESLPEWIRVRKVQNYSQQLELETKLDKGEASSITLALDLEDSVLIIDEFKGRKIAKSYNLEIIGTIGVLLLADKKGLIDDLIATLLQVVNGGFRLSNKLLDKLIEQYRKK